MRSVCEAVGMKCQPGTLPRPRVSAVAIKKINPTAWLLDHHLSTATYQNWERTINKFNVHRYYKPDRQQQTNFFRQILSPRNATSCGATLSASVSYTYKVESLINKKFGMVSQIRGVFFMNFIIVKY